MLKMIIEQYDEILEVFMNTDIIEKCNKTELGTVVRNIISINNKLISIKVIDNYDHDEYTTIVELFNELREIILQK